MGRQEVIDGQVSAIQSGQLEVLKSGLGVAFDAGMSESGGGGFTQTDIDNAVAAAVLPLNDQIVGLQGQVQADAQVLADAQAKAQADLDAVSKSLVDMTAKEQLEELAVADVAAKIAQVQEAFDAIKALLTPAP